MSRHVLPCERCGVDVELPSPKPRQVVICEQCSQPKPAARVYDELWQGQR